MQETEALLSSAKLPAEARSASPPRRRIIENPDRRRNFEHSPSPPSRSRSPPRSPRGRVSRDRESRSEWRPRIHDSNSERYRERVRQARERENEQERKPNLPLKPPATPAEEYARLKEMRDAGRYVPPIKMRALEAQLNLIKSPEEQQRASWDILRKSINSLINKVNHVNIKDIAREVFTHNLIRARGEFCTSIMKAQSMAQPFTPVYAALVAVINSKLPQVGELLLTRLIIKFRKSFKKNKKDACLSSAIFIAHLCNHQVAHEIVALEILFLLLGQPTDDSVEIAVAFMKEVGAYLAEASKAGSNGVFERFRAILHEGALEKRTQYMIEVLFQVRKDGFKDNEIIPQSLDLVEEDDQITHMIGLDDELNGQESLRLFKFDKDFEENEKKYAEIKREILGDESEEEDEDSAAEDSVSEDEEEPSKPTSDAPMAIKDMTNVELVSLRKTIYLTIMSSMSVDEAAHKLFRVTVPEGKEIEIVNMIVECCSQEKIYNKTYGGVAVRFCLKMQFWRGLFAQAFQHYYSVIHRYETNQIRNIATLFGYVLASDALPWDVFEVVHMTEEDSTSSSRIFMKILLQEMRQEMGLQEMTARFKDEYIQEFLVNMFPKKNAADTRFSINYFTAIGLGVLTEDMREYLKNLPPPSPVRERSESRSSYGSSRSRSYSSSGSYSRSSSLSLSRSPRSRSLSPDRSPSRSPSNSRRRSRRNYSRSPAVDQDSPDTVNGLPRPGRLIRGRERARSHSGSYSSYSRSPSRPRSYSYSSGYSRSRTPRSRSRTPNARSLSRSRTPPRRTYRPRRSSRTPSQTSRSPSRSVTPDDKAASRSGKRSSLSPEGKKAPTSARKRTYSRSPVPVRESRGISWRPKKSSSRSPPVKKARSNSPEPPKQSSNESSAPPVRPRNWAEAETLRQAPKGSASDATRAGAKPSESPSTERTEEDGKRRARASDYL